MRKYFLFVFLINLGFFTFLKGETIKKKLLVMDFTMNPEVLLMETEFFKNLDIHSVKEIGVLTNQLVEKLENNLPSFDILKMEGTPNGQNNNKPSIIDLIKKGKEKEADYLVFGNIDRIELRKKKHAFEPSTEMKDPFYAHSELTFEIIDVATEKVIHVAKVETTNIGCNDGDLKTDDIKAELTSFVKRFKENMINHLVVKISETLEPIKIVKLTDGYALLESKHNTPLKRGMKMGVYIPTRPNIDNKTGEIVGDTEYLIAELKVVDASTKLVRAQIVKYSRPIEVGMICREILNSKNIYCP